jgi:hypothetical protein
MTLTPRIETMLLSLFLSLIMTYDAGEYIYKLSHDAWTIFIKKSDISQGFIETEKKFAITSMLCHQVMYGPMSGQLLGQGNK